MSKENNLVDYLTDLADAIREVEGGGDSNRINPQDFADRIRALPVRVGGVDHEWHIFFDETKPAALYGGTWEELADGTFIMAAGYDGTAGRTGGSNSHTLTEYEMPQHRHDVHIVGNQSTEYEGIMMQTQWTHGELISDFVQYTGGGVPISIIPKNITAHIWRRVS